MIKVIYFTFQHCLGHLSMFTVEGFSEMGLPRHLINKVFRSSNFRKYIRNERHNFFWKFSKFDVDFRMAAKKSKNIFCFLDNCIWISGNKSSIYKEVIRPVLNFFFTIRFYKHQNYQKALKSITNLRFINLKFIDTRFIDST